MRNARVFPCVVALALAVAGFAACGGKVIDDAPGDAGVDTAPTTKPTPTTTPTAMPACPPYRPIRGTACVRGSSCFYGCTGGYPTSIRATCPGGTWVTTDLDSCGMPPPPPPPDDCEACTRDRCGAEMMACQASEATLKGCNDLIACINSCSDDACANRCITDSTSTEGKSFVSCVYDKCIEICGG